MQSNERTENHRIEYNNSDYYHGQMKNGLRDGFGKLVMKSRGFVYEGEWAEDKQHGLCRYQYSNGDKFEGQIKNGHTSDFGRACLSDGTKYMGELENGKAHGQGILTFAKNSLFASHIGTFKNGDAHGYGIQLCKNGSVKQGIFAQGKLIQPNKDR